jgi:hypothetical protein
MLSPSELGRRLEKYFASERSYCLLNRHQELCEGTWTAGGCWVAAEALARLLPKSELWTVYDHGTPQHVVVKYRGFFFDADGVFNALQMLNKMHKEEGLRVPVLLPGLDREQAFNVGLVCPTKAVRELERELRKLLR